MIKRDREYRVVENISIIDQQLYTEILRQYNDWLNKK